jgi:hypothetical protein
LQPAYMAADLSCDIGGSSSSFFYQSSDKERRDGHHERQRTDNDEFHTHGSSPENGL